MKPKMMNRALNIGFLFLMCAPVLCCLIGSRFDYEVIFRYPALYAWITGGCGVLAAWTGCIASKRKQDSAMQIHMVMPIVSMLYVIMMLYLASWKRVILPILICPVCAVWLFRLSGKGNLFRRVFKIISMMISPVFVIFVLLFILLSDFGRTTIVRQIDSPDERHRILLVDVDQGALGGNTDVFVEHKQAAFDFGFFLMQKKSLIYRTGWGAFEDMELEWKDDATILIDGKAFQIE